MTLRRTRERLAELGTLLSSKGVDIDRTSLDWGVTQATVYKYLTRLTYAKGPIASRQYSQVRLLYFYKANRTATEIAIIFDDRLRQNRVATLARTQKLLDKLRKTDEAGVE